jgi:hypothetical protein
MLFVHRLAKITNSPIVQGAYPINVGRVSIARIVEIAFPVSIGRL